LAGLPRVHLRGFAILVLNRPDTMQRKRICTTQPILSRERTGISRRKSVSAYIASVSAVFPLQGAGRPTRIIVRFADEQEAQRFYFTFDGRGFLSL
jgi:hypothetical protein